MCVSPPKRLLTQFILGGDMECVRIAYRFKLVYVSQAIHFVSAHRCSRYIHKPVDGVFGVV